MLDAEVVGGGVTEVVPLSEVCEAELETVVEVKKSDEPVEVIDAELAEVVKEESKVVEPLWVDELSKMVELWETGGAAPRPVMAKGALP